MIYVVQTIAKTVDLLSNFVFKIVEGEYNNVIVNEASETTTRYTA